MPRKLLFIVNPNAGKKKSDKIIQTIRKTFPANIYYQFVIWKDKNNFDENFQNCGIEMHDFCTYYLIYSHSDE